MKLRDRRPTNTPTISAPPDRVSDPAAEPLGLQARVNLYLYGRASPMGMVDPNGMKETPANESPLELLRRVRNFDYTEQEATDFAASLPEPPGLAERAFRGDLLGVVSSGIENPLLRSARNARGARRSFELPSNGGALVSVPPRSAKVTAKCAG